MALVPKQKLILFPWVNKTLIIIFAVAFIVVGVRAYQLYEYVFDPNVKKDYILYVTKKTTFEGVIAELDSNQVMKSMRAFKWVAKKKECRQSLKPGRYHFKEGMNSNEAVNMLRAGLQEPVQLTFNNIRTKEQLASVVAQYIDTDSLSLLELFDSESVEEFGFTPATIAAMFIPNTYEFYWTTTAEQFGERMKAEYEKFWNEERKAKAEVLQLTPVEVATLAAIVQEETNKADEKSRVAGVYINRLKKGIPLQADPTVKYAVGDITLRRILNRHLETDSPYNTYLYPGLPPGPITFPEISSIDAVLNYEKHNLMYFCAREDFSGYHNFARTHAEHQRNADRYHAALDSMRNGRN